MSESGALGLRAGCSPWWRALAVAAAGCGGDDEAGRRHWQIEGLGSTLEEIQANAKEEGEVNIVLWPGYADVWSDEFAAATGCKVNTKDAGTGDDMISLIQSGEYDGVSASGQHERAADGRGRRGAGQHRAAAELRRHRRTASRTSRTTPSTASRTAHRTDAGRTCSMFRTDECHPGAGQLVGRLGRRTRRTRASCRSTTTTSSSRTPALYLKATQPDLGIENPYQLTQEQFDAAVALMKKLAPNVGEWWADYAKQIQSFANKDSVVGTTWPLQVQLLKADKQPVEGIKPKEGTTGWSDTWMIASKAANPNCMYLWMDHMMAPKTQATVAEGFGEAPVNLKACELTKNPDHCTEFHADDESWWEDVYYWDTPTADCGGEGGTCMTQQDWRNAWTEIRG